MRIFACPLICLSLSAIGCGGFGGASSADAASDADVLTAIAARLAEYEADPSKATPEELARLREAVQSHADAEIAEALAGRIEALASGVGALPFPLAKVAAGVGGLIAFIIVSRKRRKAI